jgi:hypothetical protein
MVAEALRDRWANRLRAIHFASFVADLSVSFAAARMGLVIEATGGGFKNKILDYVFGRLPVAALAPALNGIDDAIRAYFFVERHLKALVASVCDLIDDTDRLNGMQEAAYQAAQDALIGQRTAR